jgi:hypothetical protein
MIFEIIILLILLYILCFLFLHKLFKKIVHPIARDLINGDGFKLFAHRGGLLEKPENT